LKIPFSATNWKGHAARPRALFLLLPVAVLPSFLGEIHFAKLENSMLCSRTPQRRELDYLRLLGASLQSAAQGAGLPPGRFDLSGGVLRPLAQSHRKHSIRLRKYLITGSFPQLYLRDKTRHQLNYPGSLDRSFKTSYLIWNQQKQIVLIGENGAGTATLVKLSVLSS
jgi:hypothetical protein